MMKKKSKKEQKIEWQSYVALKLLDITEELKQINKKLDQRERKE